MSGATGRCCPVVELRQYTLKPGRRDELIELFDRHFVESQEALGMTVIGQFRDRRRPDRFVWLRGFPDMESRRRALEAFYGGPVWAEHGGAANDTMLAWDDVLLLRPLRPDAGFQREAPAARPATTVVAGIHAIPERDEGAVAECERRILPVLREEGVPLEALFVTEPARNTFPRLPVREGEHVLVWFASIAEGDLSDEALDRLGHQATAAGRPAELLLLEPTSRSMLGGGPRAARGSKHDFDFLFGEWTVHNRYRSGRLRGSTEWIEFESRCRAEPLLEGLANLDRYAYVRDGRAFEGISLRLFDPATATWTIHWADTAHPGAFIPPMTGSFAGGVGEFYGHEFVDGREVLCRFLWTWTSDGQPRWEQAFSGDGGATWETNWIMSFARA